MRNWKVTITESYIEDASGLSDKWTAWIVETLDDEGHSVKIAGRTSLGAAHAKRQARSAINRWVTIHQSNPKATTFVVATK